LGRNVDQPEDRSGTQNSMADDPRLDLNEPVFDPAHPELFDSFIAEHRRWLMDLFKQQFGEKPRLAR